MAVPALMHGGAIRRCMEVPAADAWRCRSLTHCRAGRLRITAMRAAEERALSNRYFAP
jgi:hypothetical protein